MPQARITINAVVGSNDDLPINTIVALNNQNIGGETTYQWTILSQPPGTTDSLSSTTTQNPTFTPKKEGTYLIKLSVNNGLPTEQNDIQIVGIRQIKSRLRVPAPGETTQDSSASGWADPTSPASGLNQWLRQIDGQLADPVTVVGVNSSGGTITAGTILVATSGAVLKSGLPGQETVPGFTVANATTTANCDGLLCVAISDISGNTSIGSNAVMKAKFLGRYPAASISGSSVGNPVYISNTGQISLTPGTIFRQVGTVMAAFSTTADIWFDGVGGFEITPINAPYVIFGAPGTLTNAFRIDGANATALVGNPARFLAGSASTVALQSKGATSQTADLYQALNSSSSVLTGIDASGNVIFHTAGAGQGLYWGGSTSAGPWRIALDGSNDLRFDDPSGSFPGSYLNVTTGGAGLLATNGTQAWSILAEPAFSGSGLVISTLGVDGISLAISGLEMWQVDSSGNFRGAGTGLSGANVIIGASNDYEYVSAVTKEAHAFASEFFLFDDGSGPYWDVLDWSNGSFLDPAVKNILGSAAQSLFYVRVKLPAGATVTALSILCKNLDGSDHNISVNANLSTYNTSSTDYNDTAINSGGTGGNAITVTHGLSTVQWFSIPLGAGPYTMPTDGGLVVRVSASLFPAGDFVAKAIRCTYTMTKVRPNT